MSINLSDEDEDWIDFMKDCKEMVLFAIRLCDL